MFNVKLVADGGVMVYCGRCQEGMFYEDQALYWVRKWTGEHAERKHGYHGFFKWRGYSW